ncbi:MAG TPA: hypothetical protein PLV05_04055 [Verrucomicrobiota bacterium]|nr:DUF2029 domain-containing protein [Verrucomicrobiota bacterium]HRR64452.1 hypothetical protein [Candidatus Paceibacterota bacterium]MBP8015388.1 DUF2029 domain-containing protein [Verrucomicrobiota bacterium]NLH84523.1 DUF2029 domain-containing protein [Verrucomicrobiota bacterium]HNR71606.1 hypothetical protein [Verrucomicrobiota bacterium]
MSTTSQPAAHPWRRKVRRHRAWLLVGLALLLVAGVRMRLCELPLERDEGEYAYAGQLLLQGIAPYREVYAMKLPGTYAAYALMMGGFGQSATGIHLGLALVNLASIVMVFLVGRKLMGEAAGVAAAVVFALLSLSPSVLGLSAHATHFVMLAALGGTLALLRTGREEGGGDAANGPGSSAGERSRAPALRRSAFAPRPFVAGLLFGLAFLMKQHGAFFGLFGALYLLWVRGSQWRAAARVTAAYAGGRSSRAQDGFDFRRPAARASRNRLARDLGLYVLGWLLPGGVTVVVLGCAGVLRPFLFWTISYASQYAAAIPIVRGPDVLRASLRAVASPNLLLWILPWFGVLVMWWERRLDEESARAADRRPGAAARGPASAPPPAQDRSRIAHPRSFLMLWLFCSAASASVGFYFREHYFILVLPALAWLSGVAVSRGLYLLKHDRTIELFLAIPMLGLFALGLGAALIGHGAVWFTLPVDQAMRSIFGSTLFAETARVADYLKTHAPSDARIAVLGSEPEIYFQARRRAATGHIYMYPLTETTPYALKLQEDLIAEIERVRPAYVVYVDNPFSWLARPDSPQRIFEWWRDYWAANLDLVLTVPVEEGLARGSDMNQPAPGTATGNHILVFKRRP